MKLKKNKDVKAEKKKRYLVLENKTERQKKGHESKK